MTGLFVLSWSVGFFLEAPGVTGHELVESPVHRRRKVLSCNISKYSGLSFGGGGSLVRLDRLGPFGLASPQFY